MKRTIVMRLALLALITVMAVGIQLSGEAAASEYDEGELIIKFDEAFSSEIEGIKTELDVYRVQVLHAEIKIAGGFKTTCIAQYWEYRSTQSLADIIQIYKDRPYISYIEPNYSIRLLGIPDDSHFDGQWGLHNTGQSSGTADADIDAPEAWDYADGKLTSEVMVAVIDTGVDTGHPDLQANIHSFGYDYHNNDTDPSDDNGHGTHIAGTIAAVRNNTAGVAGVCGSAKIIALKLLDENGKGSLMNAIGALKDARDMGAKIINVSWTLGDQSQALKEVIESAELLLVAAAGNSGDNNDANPQYPASYDLDNIISVASTDHNDGLSAHADWSSNYGASSVDLAAPGSEIYSTWKDGGYEYDSGTSMAAAHVSGVAALIWSLDPGLSYSEVKQRILSSVDPVPALDGKVVTGGRLNAYKALPVSPANVVPDMDISTPEIESAIPLCGNDEVRIAVTAQNVTDLDTYQVEVNFPTDRLQFLEGAEGDNLLKQNGGTTMGFQAVEHVAGTINIANAIVGSDYNKAADGSGILALLKFKVLRTGDDSDIQLTLGNVFFIDCNGNEETITNLAVGTISIDASCRCLLCDFDGDGTVGIPDLALFADHWLLMEDGADWNPIFNVNGTPDAGSGKQVINYKDLGIFADCIFQ